MSLPVGTIISYVGQAAALNTPKMKDWLLCNGQSVSIRRHQALFDAIEYTFGKKNDNDDENFRLPDLRGMFLRGVDNPPSGNDPDGDARLRQYAASGDEPVGRAVGSVQVDSIKEHNHVLTPSAFVSRRANNDWHLSTNRLTDSQDVATLGQTEKTGTAETRPKNVYVYYLIFAGTSQET